MNAQSQTWQVMSEGQVYETDLETLKEWVAEGRVLPTDKVSKGSLSWIEARRAPVLRSLFPAPDGSLPDGLAVRMAQQPETGFEQTKAELLHTQPVQDTPVMANALSVSSSLMTPLVGAACYYHAEVSPKFICRICAAVFCEQCPKFVGATNIPICPLCGDLCKPYEEERKKTVQRLERESGFGLKDLAVALRYPFQNIFGVLCMAVIYGFLLLAGLKGQLLAYMVLFGTITLVINNVACGRLDRNFIPDFSEFSWWDDAIVPAFLGIGIWIVTIGPIIALALAFWFGWLGEPSPTLNPIQSQAQQQQQTQFTQEDFNAIVKGDDPQKDAEAAKKIEQLRTAPYSELDSQYKRRNKEGGASSLIPILKALSISPWIMVVAALFVIWAIFYYPMALAVAGYTEDFGSVINPLIGLDTMRRMGLVYIKAFLMYLVVQTVGVVLSVGVAIVMAPFDLPLVGNLPARFIDGMITFYANLVIACILGLALYKCADRLGIQTD